MNATWEYLSNERIFDGVNFSALAQSWNKQVLASIEEGSFTYSHLGTTRKVLVDDVALIDASDLKKFATKKVSANAEWAARRLIGATGSINIDQEGSSSSAGIVELENLVPDDAVDEAPETQRNKRKLVCPVCLSKRGHRKLANGDECPVIPFTQSAKRRRIGREVITVREVGILNYEKSKMAEHPRRSPRNHNAT